MGPRPDVGSRAPVGAAEIVLGPLRLNPQLCTAMRYARSACRACTDACTLHALRRDGRRWEPSALCDSCGACAGACPTGALDLASPALGEMEARVRRRLEAAPGGEVTFACERTPHDADADALPCVARIDEATLVSAVSKGAGCVRIRVGDCRGCDRRERLARVFPATLRATHAVLEACGLARGRVRVVRAEGAGAMPGRRDLFRRLVRAALPADPAAPRRRRLAEAVRSLGVPPRAVPSRGLPMARISINGACLGCNVCEFVCAPSAIERVEAPVGRVTLRFDAAMCTACGACAEACFPKAVALTPVERLDLLGARPRETLAVLAARACVSCRESFFSSTDDSCPRCRPTSATRWAARSPR